MDFVASRASEARHGWRNRVGDLLRSLGATVFDPWRKPDVRGLYEYGKEGIDTIHFREEWSFDPSEDGAAARARCTDRFWETLHIDLRMVDASDFTIAYCPTNIYSVGTPHEIILCRQQHKPVLFVSPAVEFTALHALRNHLADDAEGTRLLQELESQVPIRENPRGIPSLWYMPLVGGDRFFDGFGFEPYRERFGWERIALDEHEERRTPQNPLIPFLERLDRELPQKWDSKTRTYIRDDDWLLWDI